MNLTAANTAIVLDSTADLPDAAERFPNWRVVPLYVLFGNESFKDGVDISSDEFYARLRSDPQFPSTSQPTPADFLRCYRELHEYERIYSLHLSSKVSGTFESAENAAEELGHHVVRAVDSETASIGIAMLARAIQRRLERGTTDDEIDELIARYKREAGVLFTVDTLEFLQRGGRIGKAAAFAGGLLHVKPVLSIVNGEVTPVKRVRGEKKAFAEIVETLETKMTDEPGWRISVAHAAAPTKADELEALIRERRPNAEIEFDVPLGAVVGAHAGPGTLGLFWFRHAGD
jgi:DegV family protein with EDD domain